MTMENRRTRVITQEFFDDILIRAKIASMDSDFYDELMDETLVRIVRSTVGRYFRGADAEDALQEIRIAFLNRIVGDLNSGKYRTKEDLEASITANARYVCLSMLGDFKKTRYREIEYDDAIKGEDVALAYDGLDNEHLQKVVESLWNFDTKALKLIFFIQSELLDPDIAADPESGPDPLEITGMVQKLALRYAKSVISPVSENPDAWRDIICEKIYREDSLFSRTVIDLDDQLLLGGFEKSRREAYRKIIGELNAKVGERRFGSRTVARAVIESKKQPAVLEVLAEPGTDFKVDKALVLIISDYITKGIYRVQEALNPIIMNLTGRK